MFTQFPVWPWNLTLSQGQQKYINNIPLSSFTIIPNMKWIGQMVLKLFGIEIFPSLSFGPTTPNARRLFVIWLPWSKTHKKHNFLRERERERDEIDENTQKVPDVLNLSILQQHWLCLSTYSFFKFSFWYSFFSQLTILRMRFFSNNVITLLFCLLQNFCLLVLK